MQTSSQLSRLCVAVCLMGAVGVAHADEAGPAASDADMTNVRVDWSKVPDSVIERCSLGNLQGLLLQYLLEAKYAIVDDAVDDVIAVSLRADELAFHLSVTRGSNSRGQRIQIPATCDPSFQLVVIRAMLPLLDELRSIRPAPPRPLKQTPPVVETPTRPVDPTPAPERDSAAVALAIGAVLPGTRPLASASVRLLLPWHRRLSAGIAAEVAAARWNDVWVLEPALSLVQLVTVMSSSSLQIKAGMEASGLAHIYRGPGLSDQQVDFRGGGLAELWLPSSGLGVGLSVFGRAYSYTHLDGSDILFESGHWGMSLRVGWTTL